MELKVIKTQKQYSEYCDALWSLLKDEEGNTDKIELLELLIDTYDKDVFKRQKKDPVEILQLLMETHDLKQKDIASILNITEAAVSQILHYKKGMSKDVVRGLADHFKVSQESLNQSYPLRRKKHFVAGKKVSIASPKLAVTNDVIADIVEKRVLTQERSRLHVARHSSKYDASRDRIIRWEKKRDARSGGQMKSHLVN